MATAGEFENISTEIKNKYPNLSYIYEGVFRTEAPYRAELKRNDDYEMNEGIVKFPMKLNGQWSVGMIADNADFAPPKNPTVVQAQLTPVMFQTAIQVGYKTTKAAASGKSTFNSKGIVADRLDDAAAELASYIDRVYAGSNRGRLAVVESDGANNFVANKTPTGTELLEEGMVLEARDALTGSVAVRDSFSAHKITAIDHDTRTVTYVNNTTGANDDRALVAGDHIFISGSYAETPFTLPDIVDDGTNCAVIFGITRSANPKTKAFVLGNGGTRRDLTEALLQQAASGPRRKVGKKITKFLMADGQWQKISAFIHQQREWVGATESDPRYKLGVGKGGVNFVHRDVNATIQVCDDVQPRTAYALAWDQFFLYMADELSWVEDGGGLLKLVPSSNATYKSAFQAMMASVENQGCKMPRANARIDDLVDPIFGD